MCVIYDPTRLAVSQPLPAPAARLPLCRRRPPLLQDLRPDDALLRAGAVGARRQGRRARHPHRPRRLPVGAQVGSLTAHFTQPVAM